MAQLYTKRSRLPVKISRVVPEDMLEFAEGQLKAFGTRMYAELEPDAIRAPPEVRYRRFAHRHSRLLSLPTEMPMKATVQEPDGTERIAGCAWWHVPGAPIDNNQKRRIDGEETEEDKESWEGFNWQKWTTMLDSYDRVRKEKMGDEPHWYVGPVWTHPDYQGQGICMLLLQQVIDIADSTNPPTPLYLEASAAGRPVYAKMGWVQIDGTETAMLRRGPLGK
ncbi:GNAT family N-acetyltransferase [Sporobolomyces salmoneus]|uniref:GNAT family N-acetyltransferase n=1 Tax=Sporobolomyces salmoneus TaxID=183962 RepID=UPI00317F5ECD